MLQIELNMYQAVAVAALVLLLGRFLVSKIPFLTKYCNPEPVVGGVVDYLHALPVHQPV